jgi:nucleotide-binding universal stress UspA family protein
MSTASESALKYARHFYERFGSKVFVVHAHHFEFPAYFSRGQIEDLKRQLEFVAKTAENQVRKQTEPILGFSPGIEAIDKPPIDAILDASQAHNAELVVMGMHGHRGWERLWMGSVTEQVIRRSSIPVLAVSTATAEAPVRHILCPANSSNTGQQALEYAAEVSKTYNAHLTVLNVVEQGDDPLVCPLVDESVKKSCNVKEINLRGNAAKTIAETSNNLKPDLIVMGAERKSAVMGEFFSSTTSSVMQLAIGPLMVVPKKETNS